MKSSLYNPYDILMMVRLHTYVAIDRREEEHNASISDEEVERLASDIYAWFTTSIPEIKELIAYQDVHDAVFKEYSGYCMTGDLKQITEGDYSQMAQGIARMWDGEGHAKAAYDLERWRNCVVYMLEHILISFALEYVFCGDPLDRGAGTTIFLEKSAKFLDPKGVITSKLDEGFFGAAACSAAGWRDEYKSGEYLPKYLAENRKRAPEGPVRNEDQPSAAVPASLVGVTYRIPPNYWPWSRVKAYIQSLVDWKDSGYAQVGEDLAALDAKKLVEAGCPIFLVGEQFLHELEDTDMCIDDLRILEEAPLPAESCLLLLPNGAFSVTLASGEAYFVKALHLTVTAYKEHKFLFVASVFETARGIESFVSRIPFRGDGTLIDQFDEFDLFARRISGNGQGAATHVIDISLKAGAFVSKILAAIAAEPKIVEAATQEGFRKAKKGRPELRFMYPPVIGWRVKYVRDLACNRSKEKHGSPVAHWRRRHIRRVPYGPTSVPLHARPRRIVVISRTRVNSEYEKGDGSAA